MEMRKKSHSAVAIIHCFLCGDVSQGAEWGRTPTAYLYFALFNLTNSITTKFQENWRKKTGNPVERIQSAEARFGSAIGTHMCAHKPPGSLDIDGTGVPASIPTRYKYYKPKLTFLFLMALNQGLSYVLLALYKTIFWEYEQVPSCKLNWHSIFLSCRTIDYLFFHSCRKFLQFPWYFDHPVI